MSFLQDSGARATRRSPARVSFGIAIFIFPPGTKLRLCQARAMQGILHSTPGGGEPDRASRRARAPVSRAGAQKLRRGTARSESSASGRGPVRSVGAEIPGRDTE